MLFLASDFDAKLTGDLMKAFEKEGKVTIPDQLKTKLCETIEGKGEKKIYQNFNENYQYI